MFVFFGKAGKLRAQHRQNNQIRNGHQAVNGFRKEPHRAGFQHRSHDNRKGLQNHKAFPHMITEQILGTANTVKAPAQNRGNGKAAQCQRNDQTNPIPTDIGKCLSRQGDAHILPIWDRNSADQNDQCSHCADHNGIEKYLHNAHHALLCRVIDLG